MEQRSGLGVAFLSIMSMDTIASMEFATRSERNIVMSIAKLLAVWGMMVVAAVWAQVGQHATQSVTDGRTPIHTQK